MTQKVKKRKLSMSLGTVSCYVKSKDYWYMSKTFHQIEQGKIWLLIKSYFLVNLLDKVDKIETVVRVFVGYGVLVTLLWVCGPNSLLLRKLLCNHLFILKS